MTTRCSVSPSARKHGNAFSTARRDIVDDAQRRECVTVESDAAPSPKFAFIGVRACELHAIAIQDRVFSRGLSGYGVCHAPPERFHCRGQLRRRRAEHASVCRWRRARRQRSGFDLALTELLDGDSHQFWLRSAATRARKCLSEFRGVAATDQEIAESGRGRRPNRESDGPQPGDGGIEGTAAGQPRIIRAGTMSPSAASPAATARWCARLVSARRSRITAI